MMDPYDSARIADALSSIARSLEKLVSAPQERRDDTLTAFDELVMQAVERNGWLEEIVHELRDRGQG